MLLTHLMKEYIEFQVPRLYFDHPRSYLVNNTRPHLFAPILNGSEFESWKCLSCILCHDCDEDVIEQEIDIDSFCNSCRRIVHLNSDNGLLECQYLCNLCQNAHKFGENCDEFKVGYHSMKLRDNFTIVGMSSFFVTIGLFIVVCCVDIG